MLSKIELGTAMIVAAVLAMSTAPFATNSLESKVAKKDKAAEEAPLDEDLIVKAYNQARVRGYNSFMEQNGKVVKEQNYTSSENEITEGKIKKLEDKERKAVMEAMGVGYADGYHAAGKSTLCPRFCEPNCRYK